MWSPTGRREQASRAGNLLGILAATVEDEADATASERRAADTFEAAVRAFPAAVEPKYNLELLLRRIRVVGLERGPGKRIGNPGRVAPGAGAGAPGLGVLMAIASLSFLTPEALLLCGTALIPVAVLVMICEAPAARRRGAPARAGVSRGGLWGSLL